MLQETKTPTAPNAAGASTSLNIQSLQDSISSLSTMVDSLAKTKTVNTPPFSDPVPSSCKKPRSFVDAVKTLASVDKAKAKKNSPAPDGKEVPKKVLPTAERRFYAPRTNPEAFAKPQTITVALSVVIGRTLKAANLPNEYSVAVSTTINANGTVSLQSGPTTSASLFVSNFSLLIKALNEAAPVSSKPFTSFRTAPDNVDVAIHNIPTFAIPDDNCDELTKVMAEAIMFSANTQISNARYLKPNPIARKDTKTTSIVVSCSAADATQIGSSIRLFSRACKANVMCSASPSTQCQKCWQFGHATQGCTKLEPVCPL
jgi:hypothetical protein